MLETACYRDTAWNSGAHALGELLVAQLREGVADADVYFIGALSLGLNGHNDVDLNVHVRTDDSELFVERGVVISKILGHEPTAHEQHLLQWEYVSRGVEVDVIAYDNGFQGADEQIRIHDLLAHNEQWRSEYAELKRAHDGAPLNEYREAKKRFFKEVLERLT